jgi:hypothetical protein
MKDLIRSQQPPLPAGKARRRKDKATLAAGRQQPLDKVGGEWEDFVCRVMRGWSGVVWKGVPICCVPSLSNQPPFPNPSKTDQGLWRRREAVVAGA